MTDLAHRAALLVDSGRARQAAQLLGPHLAAVPDDVRARRVLGWAQLVLDEKDAAFRNAGAVVAADPDDPENLRLLASVHSARGEVAQAQQAAAALIRAAPQSSAAYQAAVVVDLDGDVAREATVQHALTAIRLDPLDPDAHRLAGSTLLTLKRRPEAAVHLRRAAELAPTDTTIIAELARLDHDSGRTGSAARGFATAVRADPTDRIALWNLAATVWRTYSIAQIALWATVFVLIRVRYFTGNEDIDAWIHAIAPIAVLITLAVWGWQLRAADGGIAVMRRVVGTDRMLQIGLLSHALCLFALLATALLPTAPSAWAFGIAAVLLALSSVTTWIKSRQAERDRPR